MKNKQNKCLILVMLVLALLVGNTQAQVTRKFINEGENPLELRKGTTVVATIPAQSEADISVNLGDRLTIKVPKDENLGFRPIYINTQSTQPIRLPHRHLFAAGCRHRRGRHPQCVDGHRGLDGDRAGRDDRAPHPPRRCRSRRRSSRRVERRARWGSWGWGAHRAP